MAHHPMISSLRTLGFALTALLTLVTYAGAAGNYDYIDINNPMMKKIPIAIPDFKPLTGNSMESTIGGLGSREISDALEFTGYFRSLDKGSFLVDIKQSDVAAPQFKAWTTAGAEFLITGAVMVNNNQIDLELRFFDTIQERLLLGKKYTGILDDRRRMIKRFCSEIMKLLFGNAGLFESQIVFVSSTGPGKKEIFISDFDGTSPKQITHNGSVNLSPALSSDGQYVAYTSYAGGKPDLYIQHIGSQKVTLVDQKGIGISPSWVPGKNELAAALSFSGDPDIYLLTISGKIINKIVDNPGIDISPSFSPDGRKIAFVSKRAGNPQIYIQDLASGNVNRLTYDGNNNTQPDWSPKGDKIVYTAMVKGLFQIMVIGVDGKGQTQLTYNGDNESPSWSPDGSMIVFSTTREGSSRIYVMTAYGTDQRKIVDLAGQQSEPKWSPSLAN
jgi:TolB protein